MRRNDLTLYERHAHAWWDASSPAFRSLHAAKTYHRELLLARWGDRLKGARLVDLGAGGGLLSVPLLSHLGSVIAVDLSAGSLSAARAAARERGHHNVQPLRADLCATGLPPGYADLVTLSDVIEHVPDADAALREAARILRPGGALFVNTLNKTVRARWLAVYLAEGIGLIPKGTHDPAMFITPEDLVARAARVGLDAPHVVGETTRVCRTVRRWAIHLRESRSTAVSYSVFFQRADSKPAAAPPTPRPSPS